MNLKGLDTSYLNQNWIVQSQRQRIFMKSRGNHKGKICSRYVLVFFFFLKIKLRISLPKKKNWFAMEWMFVPPRIICWNLTFNLIALGSEVSGKYTGHKVGALTNEISGLIKRPCGVP